MSQVHQSLITMTRNLMGKAQADRESLPPGSPPRTNLNREIANYMLLIAQLEAGTIPGATGSTDA